MLMEKVVEHRLPSCSLKGNWQWTQSFWSRNGRMMSDGQLNDKDREALFYLLSFNARLTSMIHSIHSSLLLQRLEPGDLCRKQH